MAVRSAVISKDRGAACAVVLTKSDVAGPELWLKRFLLSPQPWLYSKNCWVTASKLEGEKTGT